MTKKPSELQSNFEQTLQWLNPDREQAGRKYEAIRRRLVEILASRGCYEAEHWADVTIDRVISKIHEISNSYQGDPAHYFCGVARMVFLEYLKKRPPVYIPPAPPGDVELEHSCLEHCLERLPRDDRNLIRTYYTKDGREKIDNRNELAAQLGIGLNALRIKTHRIRIVVKHCLHDCLAGSELKKDYGQNLH